MGYELDYHRPCLVGSVHEFTVPEIETAERVPICLEIAQRTFPKDAVIYVTELFPVP